MKEMRLIGNMVQKLSKEREINDDSMCEKLDCTMNQYQSFLNGRMFLSFKQLEMLANYFGITIDSLLDGDCEYYEKNIVHCMGNFENLDNRETILDIIDDYLSLKTSVQ